MKNMLQMVVVMSILSVGTSYAAQPYEGWLLVDPESSSDSLKPSHADHSDDNKSERKMLSTNLSMEREIQASQIQLPWPVVLTEAAFAIAWRGTVDCVSCTGRNVFRCGVRSTGIGCAAACCCVKHVCVPCCTPVVRCIYDRFPVLRMDR